jgi:antitoxin (DNA-binding transcriptional repressor) of toxin-antitoxin stability system
MKEAKISEVKDQLSRFLALVRRGETVRILDRDTPVAMIVPLPRAAGAGDDAVLLQLERKGLVQRGSGRIPREILRSEPSGKSAGVLQALLDEREER